MWIARIHLHTYINTLSTTLCEAPAQLLQNLDLDLASFRADRTQTGHILVPATFSERESAAVHLPLDFFRADRTQTGHILGPAAQRGPESVPERQLSAVECALLRFLTHAALYLAANNPAQVFSIIIIIY